MLCSFAHEFPPMVAAFLERDRKLRRHFREETITDLLMGSLAMMGGRRLIVEFPDEPKTGADMQWDFVNEKSNTYLSLLIQAKRLFGEGKFWRRHNYREILHTTGAGGPLQAEVLCDTARASVATVPIYMFYNPQQSCNLAHAGGGPNVLGVNWMDGYLVENLVKSASTQQLRTHNKSLAAVYASLMSLPDLLCPSGVLPFPIIGRAIGWAAPGAPLPLVLFRGRIGVAMPPRPEDIRARLAGARERIRAGVKASEPAAIELPSIPQLVPVPQDVRLRITRYRSREVAAEPTGYLPHWRVTFLSTEPPTAEELANPQG